MEKRVSDHNGKKNLNGAGLREGKGRCGDSRSRSVSKATARGGINMEENA